MPVFSIGIFTAEQSLHGILQADREIRRRFHVTYLPYSTAEHLCYLYEQNASRFDGLIFSGSYPYHLIEERFGRIPVPHTYFTLSDRDYYYVIARLAVQEPGLDFSRVFMDAPEVPVDFECIFGRPGVPLMDGGAAPDLPYADLYPTTLAMDRELWQSGRADLIVTRLRNMEADLKKEGIRYAFLGPSPQTMMNTFLELELQLTAALAREAGEGGAAAENVAGAAGHVTAGAAEKLTALQVRGGLAKDRAAALLALFEGSPDGCVTVRQAALAWSLTPRSALRLLDALEKKGLLASAGEDAPRPAAGPGRPGHAYRLG